MTKQSSSHLAADVLGFSGLGFRGLWSFGLQRLGIEGFREFRVRLVLGV